MTLRIEDLKVGDELECIDRDGFLSLSKTNGHSIILNRIIDNVIIVNRIDNDIVLIDKSTYYLNSYDLKYFKKKDQYAFDDLIDVVRNAFKDGFFDSYCVSNDGINICTDPKEFLWKIRNNEKSIIKAIEQIKSLYKETFVIETEEDLDRFNKDVEITLANDEKLSWEDLKSIGLMNTHAIFKALKGATVTQSR